MAFTHILLPTDFSEPANRALHYALEQGHSVFQLNANELQR
jgi:hypothetical protein